MLQLATGVTDKLPDIVLIEDFGAQKYLFPFPGAFQPLNDALDYSGVAEHKVELATAHSKTYSLPFDPDLSGFFHRSDLMAEAGFGPDDLKDITRNRLIQTAEELHGKTGVAMLGPDINNARMIRIMLQSAGNWDFTPEGDLNIEGDPVFCEATRPTRILPSSRMAGLPSNTPGFRPSISWSQKSLSMLIRGSPHLRATTPEHKIQDSPRQRGGQQEPDSRPWR